MTQFHPPLTTQVRHGLHPELHEIAAQLHRDFDDLIGAEVVDRVLDEVAARFVDARVRTFLPLLVHRYARSDLRAVSKSGPGADPVRSRAGGPPPTD
ncbi:three-helix bundle dimerization domain-containing protein [Oryzihumus leptocrescens]|uniref:Protein-tyrosine-phosphatase-like N-terminal domain-containing protein n=1 Tax=Oryzihumus leptocrescens TaxID=297536 RepID=A0A542ZIS2_9MICO|nr:hypothetical protein [Oryzihumus leptocrescens]TQL60060.1 hypothetical protein FB474_1436 [Oryzihumus leptocrescens]